MKNKKMCFVIMPFSETDSLAEAKWTEIFKHIIKPAVGESRLGYECKRYGLGRANIIKDILQDLNTAQVVIADLTDDNANVLWELGVRHTLKRRTIFISQDKKFIPSDLDDYPVIPYDQTKTGFDTFKQDIKEKLKDIEAHPDKPDSPVADFLQVKNIDLLAYEKSANLRKLSALISELSYNIDKTDTILNQLNKAQEARKKGDKARFVTPVRLSNTSLELLLTTQYISLSQQLSEFAYLVNQIIGLTNRNLDIRPEFGDVIDEILIKVLSGMKKDFVNLLIPIRKISVDYANDNYQEPKEPTIILANPKHAEYLKILE